MPQPWLLHLGMQHVLPDVFPPTSHFKEEDIPDQKGRTILITGASSGLGYRQAEVLLKKGAKVYVTARAQEKADKIAGELSEATGNKQCHALAVELGDPDTIKACAKQFLTKEQSLDCLVNNGGAMHTKQDSLSKSGHEMQFASNVLGPWLLTQLLLPALEKTASAKGEARVVWLSSFASSAAPKEGINFDVLDKGTDASDQDTAFGSKQYGQSKLANIFLAKEMAKRYADKKILNIALHPGVVESPLWRNSKSLFGKLNYHVFSIPIAEGTMTQLYASTSKDLTLKDDNGVVLTCIARRAPKKFHKMQNDPELAKRTWDYCEEEYGKYR